MTNDPIRGKTLRFRFSDGQMANKTVEHRFDENGTLTFQMIGGEPKSPSKDEKPTFKYEVARVRDDVYAVSYQSSGYTLTTVLDLASKKLVAFSSNEKMLSVQHGTFEYAESQPASRAHAPS